LTSRVQSAEDADAVVNGCRERIRVGRVHLDRRPGADLRGERTKRPDRDVEQRKLAAVAGKQPG